MELKDTVEGMCSSDYKERFIAEYKQNFIRYKKLKDFCDKIRTDETVKHDCPLDLLEEQLNAMGYYLELLEDRAKIEKINISFEEERKESDNIKLLKENVLLKRELKEIIDKLSNLTMLLDYKTCKDLGLKHPYITDEMISRALCVLNECNVKIS